MLQFWKKSGQKEKVEKSGKNQSPSKLPLPRDTNGDVPGCKGRNTVDFLCELNDEDLAGDISDKCTTPRSQLSKTLAEVLSDKGALGYFIQYLDVQDHLSLIKFWLDVESFRAAASTRNYDGSTHIVPVTRDQLDLLDDPTRLSPQPSQRSLGTDCDSIFDSPSHSIDSTDNIYPANTCHRSDGVYVTDIQDIRTSLSNKCVHTTLQSNSSTTVNTHTNNIKVIVRNKTISHPLEDLPSALTKNNSSENCLQTLISRVDGNKETHCDLSVLTSNSCITSETYSATSSAGANCKRTEVNQCDYNSASFPQSREVSNLLNTQNTSNILCDQISVNTKESENCFSDRVGEYPTKSNVDASPSHLDSLPPKQRSTVRGRICANVLQAVVDDALRIYGKYLSLGSTHKVPINNAIRERVIIAICKEDGFVDAETFTEAQVAIFCIMERDHFNNFLHSDFHCKHQIDVLTSGKVTMADILYNETALFYFMEFMEQEGNRHLVEFWLAAINFQQHLLTRQEIYDPLEAQNDAMILYDKYFSLQATSPLGFGDQVRFAVEQDICREEGPLPDCFTRPVSIVQHTLQKNFLQPFLTSQLHFKYLSELVNTIQASPALLARNSGSGRKSGSECSSEWSISVQNTLLASEDSSSVSNRALRRMGAKELSIDSYQLNDPDSLWKRRQHRGLTFGRINHMGRFETDVEPEPDRKEESRITKVVKKLVNMEEDKAKEEMAWQIAEMIINDITSLTLGNGEPVES